MVDWMVQVFNVLKMLSTKTFFISVAMMDLFFEEAQKSNISLQSDLLYLIGMTSVFIACKHEEVNPLGIRLVEDTLGHKKYTKAQILTMERKILEATQFKVPKTTIFEETIIKLRYLQSLLSSEIFEEELCISLYPRI